MPDSELQIEKPKPGLVAVDGKAFPLEGARILASARGGIALSTLRQSYRNPYDEPLEVTYTLPLPADGAVLGFDIRMGEKRITGEIETHDKALRKYREALETGRVAGILEQDRADTFTQNLGNVPPKTAVEVEIRVLHPVAFHGAGAVPDSAASADAAQDLEAASAAPGTPDPATVSKASTAAASLASHSTWEYRFPTVTGVRYEGAPGRVRDRDRLDVDRADAGGTPVRLTLDLTIEDGTPADISPSSTSHSIHVAAGPAPNSTHVTFTEPSRLDRDVTVRWRTATDEVGLRLVEGTGLDKNNGRYGLLTIVPPNRPQRTLARDLTLLIDASGSMVGPSIQAAREISMRLLKSLGPKDRFQILAFASEVQRLVGNPTEATPSNIDRARQALAALQASGSTEMAKALDEALRPLRGDSQRQVVLLTDGYIGFEHEVVQRIVNDLPPGARLHVVGIGNAPNRTLTHGASRAGRGVEVLVTGPRTIEEAAARLLAATVAPVLTDIVIDGTALAAVAPARLRDVLAGQPLVVALELKPKGGTVRVSGMVPGSSEGWSRTVHVPASAGKGKAAPGEPGQDHSATAVRRTDLPIGALFGREAIEDEEMKLAAATGDSRETQEILKRIEALGLRHRITSRCTTLVAVADEPSVDPTKPRRRQRLPVEMPAGVNPEAVGYAAPGGMTLRASRTVLFSVEGSLRGLPDVSARPVPERETRGPAEVMARYVRSEEDLLVIEFESPRHHFRFPQDGTVMAVIISDGVEITASIDTSLSTGPGPHARGLTLRLALRRVDGAPWRPGRVRLTVSRLDGIQVDVDIP